MEIFLQSYFDMNLGDDLMIKGLLERYPEHVFYARTNNTSIKISYSEHGNIKFISRKEKLRIIFKSDAFVTLGGSVFQYFTYKDLIRRLTKILIILIYRLRGKKVITIGSNFGPMEPKLSPLFLRLELRLNNLVTVRDRASYDLGKKTIPHKIFLGNDIVHEILTDPSQEKVSIRKGKRLGISCYNSVVSPSQTLRLNRELVKFIQEYIKKNPADEVVLFSFNTNKENDEKSAKYIKEHFPENDNIFLISYTGNMDEFLAEFSTCNKVVAVRFHSAILSEVYEIPFIPIAYSNKMYNYVKEKYRKTPMKMEEIGSENMHLIKYFQKNTCIPYKENRESHFEKMDIFLEEVS